MKLLDTSIFIYAQGRPHRFYEPCRALVARLGTGSDEYVIDTELLQEVLHVYSLRGERGRALRTFDHLVTLFPKPIPITVEEMSLARQFLEQYPVLSSRDAIHVAVVFTQHLEGIVTTDKGMAEVGEVPCYDPLSLYPR